jgi:hypothetical protein
LEGLHKNLNQGGELFIFEHNPYNPLTRRIVNNCEFDDDAILLTAREIKSRLLQSKFRFLQTHYTLFFPGFLSKLRFLEKYMEWLPLGGQYFVHAIKD